MIYDFDLAGGPARGIQVELRDLPSMKVETSSFHAWFGCPKVRLWTRLNPSFGLVNNGDVPSIVRLAHELEISLGEAGPLRLHRMDLPRELSRDDLIRLSKIPMSQLWIDSPDCAVPIAEGPFSKPLGEWSARDCVRVLPPNLARLLSSILDLSEVQSGT